jgi:dedicated sortase system histidine kinase
MAEWRWPRAGLRSQWLAVALLLLVLPWLGLRYLAELELYLQRGQEQVIGGAARALALTLSDDASLFDAAAQTDGRGLYVYPLAAAPQPGAASASNWGARAGEELVLREGSAAGYAGNRTSSFRRTGGRGDPLEVRVLAGERDGRLFLLLRVVDRFLQLAPEAERPSLAGSDAVRLTTLSAEGVSNQFRLPLAGDGEVQFWQAGDDPEAAYTYRPASDVDASLLWQPEGYQLLLSLPLALTSQGLAVGVEDVDDPERRALAARVASGDLAQVTADSLRLPRRAFAERLGGQLAGNYRLQVYDSDGNLLFEEGDLASARGLLPVPVALPGDGLLGALRVRLLQPLYAPQLRWLDRWLASRQLYSQGPDSPQLTAALAGLPQTGYRQDGSAEPPRLEAGWPVLADGRVLGALLLDQNLDGLRTLRHAALSRLFDTALALMLVSTLALWLLASSLSSRLRRLRDQAERSIDEQGRLNRPFVAARSRDEIGDLSRSIGSLVERLGRYNQYLENLTARLSHELRTPVTVVRTSLENLRLLGTQDAETEVYLQRAEEGISRLSLILANMSEATRLEQLLQRCEKQPLRLDQWLAACVEQYRQIYPAVDFRLQRASEPLLIEGSAEHLVQLLDKVVANAVEFSTPGRPIRLRADSDNGDAVLSVSNYGPTLDPGMQDRIFDSMVSARPQGQQTQPHLGLGLHIARLITDFHGGSIYAENLLEEPGVIVVVRLPLQRPT